jgi:ribosome maturation factor RimP
VGLAVHLFFDLSRTMDMHTDPLTQDIEQRLASAEPEVELLLVERAGPEQLRLFIDHPDGVSLELCERVTHQLRDLLVDYGLEVSSPGPERPLTKPHHFRRFIGRRARVRLREPREGYRSYTGELVGASDDEVTVAADEGVVSIPYAEINRSNLMPEAAGSAGRAGRGRSEAPGRASRAGDELEGKE